MTCLARVVGALIALVAFEPISATAQNVPDAQPPDVIVEGQIPDANKRVCKQMTSTGSIISNRTCKTKAEWEEIRTRSLAALDQIRKDQDRQRYLQCMIHGICQ